MSLGVTKCADVSLKPRKKGYKKGYTNTDFRAIETKRNRMKITNEYKRVGDPDAFNEGTYRLAICDEYFAIDKKVVRTRTDERALVAGGAKWQAK